MSTEPRGTENRPWRVAVLPGDGIGTEVMPEATAALDVVRARAGMHLEWRSFEWPSHAWYREHGRMAPDAWLETLAEFDAILLGALGDPGPACDPDRFVLPDAISLAPLLEMRKGFDQWACERPARLYKGARQYLADDRARDLDMLVIRENSEGEYVGQGGRLAPGTPRETATQLSVFTRSGTERILRHAFDRASQRASDRQAGRRPERRFRGRDGRDRAAQVCLVTKRNALRHWGELYVEIFEDLANEYPDVATHHELVDAACMKFVQAPWAFDVVVASNLHGDILTDLAAVLSGGMGVAPSGNLNPDDRETPPMFEPTHGSAPDIAGEGRADPTATLLAAALMLAWMGEEDPAAATAAEQLRHAVADDLEAQGGTPRGTAATGTAIRARLEESRTD